jgi:hypothetical protein
MIDKKDLKQFIKIKGPAKYNGKFVSKDGEAHFHCELNIGIDFTRDCKELNKLDDQQIEQVKEEVLDAAAESIAELLNMYDKSSFNPFEDDLK